MAIEHTRGIDQSGLIHHSDHYKAGMAVSDEKAKGFGGCQQHHTGYYQLLQQQASAHEQQHDYSCAKA